MKLAYVHQSIVARQVDSGNGAFVLRHRTSGIIANNGVDGGNGVYGSGTWPRW
jgi:hypothetical protein